MCRSFLTAATLSCLAATFTAQTPGPALEALYRARDWFELRAAIRSQSPVLLRAAVATAFNDAQTGETLLRNIIRSQPRSDAANDAHGMLSQIYLRSGRYGRLLENLDAWAAAFPDRHELREAKEDVEQFRGLPNQSNGPRRDSKLKHDDDFSAPVSINGKAAAYLLDTGAWVSLMTEPEAKRLGLVIREGTGMMSDASGKGVKFRTAVAKEVVLGAMRFRDVSFAVIAHEEPLGILGIPILLGVGSMRWSKDGTLELAGTAAPSQQTLRNLVFDRHHLLLRANVLGKDVLTTFDTGATTTDLNANFATLFADVIAKIGTKGTQDSTGVGGTQTFDAITLPDAVFTIDGTNVSVRPAHVTLQRNAAMGGECCIGNAGGDLLKQGNGFTSDFSAMTLRLH